MKRSNNLLLFLFIFIFTLAKVNSLDEQVLYTNNQQSTIYFSQSRYFIYIIHDTSSSKEHFSSLKIESNFEIEQDIVSYTYKDTLPGTSYSALNSIPYQDYTGVQNSFKTNVNGAHSITCYGVISNSKKYTIFRVAVGVNVQTGSRIVIRASANNDTSQLLFWGIIILAGVLLCIGVPIIICCCCCCKKKHDYNVGNIGISSQPYTQTDGLPVYQSPYN